MNVNFLPLDVVERTFDGLADVVFCVKDLDGVYRSVNLAFVERMGAGDKSDLIGRTAADLFEPPLAETFEHQDATVLKSGRPLVDRLERIAHFDGTLGWFLASKYPWRDRAGKIVGLIGISQALNWPRESDVEIANLRRLVESIHDNLDQPLRTDRLARQIGLSSIQLDRRMKRVFGLSTKKFIMKCRLEKATRQLESTDHSISEIALACGFHDQSSLTRHFRAATSDTPARYRRQAQAAQLPPPVAGDG